MKNNSKEARLLLRNEILDIKNGMNFKRSNNDLLLRSRGHQYNITSDWLLGFVKGDGSFYIDIKKPH